jgi:hypothetical protein
MAHSRFIPALNLGTITKLPEWSTGPKGSASEIAQALLEAGYKGVQGSDDPAYAKAGLITYGSSRVAEPGEALEVLQRQVDAGHEQTTLHVGTGFETDAQAYALIENILSASQKLNHPTHIETHRATITQDIFRTLGWVEKFREMTINADLSHYYTGLEMQYGSIPEKLEIMKPIFKRVRFVHGRIGSSGCIQVPIGVGLRDEPHVTRFGWMWQYCFAGFLETAGADATIPFAPEILPETVDTPVGPLHIEYAFPNLGPDGVLSELGDRWDQGFKLTDIAKAAFERAVGQGYRLDIA